MSEEFTIVGINVLALRKRNKKIIKYGKKTTLYKVANLSQAEKSKGTNTQRQDKNIEMYFGQNYSNCTRTQKR